MRKCIVCMAAGVLLSIVGSQAGATISTLPTAGMAGTFFGDFDFMGNATVGQTITVPIDGSRKLRSFTFFIDGFPFGTQAPDPVTFNAYVMAWDGTKAVGPILWQGGPYSTTDTVANDNVDFEVFFFDTGDLPLTLGAQYVLFVSASPYYNEGNPGIAAPAGGNTPYADGQFVYFDNGDDFSRLTTENWDMTMSTFDLAFEAKFVPSPGAVVLVATGMGLVSWLRRRKTLV